MPRRGGEQFDVVEALRELSGPGLPTAVDQLGQHGHLLLEEGLVVGQVVAEEREGLDERPAPGDDLGATVAQRVEGGEALEDAHRVVGGEHGDRGGELQPRGAGGDARQEHVGGGDGEVLTVVLPDADRVQPHLVGQDGLVDDVADHHIVGQERAVRAGGDIAEGVDAELEPVDVHGVLARLRDQLTAA